MLEKSHSFFRIPNIFYLIQLIHIVKLLLVYDNLIDINAKNVILLSLDFSQQDKFNESKFIKLQSLNHLKIEYVG
jgi:hypothetical protein